MTWRSVPPLVRSTVPPFHRSTVPPLHHSTVLARPAFLGEHHGVPQTSAPFRMRLAPILPVALAGIHPLGAQTRPRLQTDSNRARTPATDTTRNRRAAGQDSTRAAAPADTNAGDRSLGGIRVRSIGPGMISGRITDLAVHPRDKKTWYIGVAAGGIWKTTNAGTTWTPVFGQQSTYQIGTVVIDPK